MSDAAEFTRLTARLKADRDRLEAENEALKRPREIKCEGGKVQVAVLPHCVSLTGPDGVSRYVWLNAQNKLETDYTPPVR